MPDEATIDNGPEVVRLTQLLAAAVKFSNTTQREIERKLGLSSGSLSRLFSGGIELKLKHVLDICEVIGFPPSRFFAAAFPHADERPESERLQRLLEQLHPDACATSSLAPAAPAAGPSTADLERTVQRLVHEALAGTFARLAGNGSGSEQQL